jgi:hypothetical protein
VSIQCVRLPPSLFQALGAALDAVSGWRLRDVVDSGKLAAALEVGLVVGRDAQSHAERKKE